MNSIRHFAIGFGIVTVVVGAALAQAGLFNGFGLGEFAVAFAGEYSRLSPDFAAFARAPLIIQIHAGSAMAALGLGLVQLFAPKGTIPHRTLGYVWVGLMLTAAVTAIFIRELNNGSFSFIHIFVPLTLFGIVGIIMNARARRTAKHRSDALGLFFGALVVPGLFAFMPGRLMWQMFFGG
jgi:uncharacterized membrane protein